MSKIGILTVNGLPYIVASCLVFIGCLGVLFSFLVIVGYLRIGLRGQPHSVIYIVIACCCIMYSFNGLTQAVGFYGYTFLNGTNTSSTSEYTSSTAEFVLCTAQSVSSSFPGNMMVYAYIIGMSGRIIATYAPLEYYRYFRYGSVIKLIMLFVAISTIELATELFLVARDYADMIGVCASTASDAYEQVNAIVRTFGKILCLLFLMISYIVIVRKFIKNRMSTAGNLTDDASKGIIAVTGTYVALSAFLPQQLVVILYILANLTLGIYMMKERNITSSGSMHNRETFFFLRLTTVFLIVISFDAAYGVINIFFLTTEEISATEMLQKYWGALVLFYVKETSLHMLGLINMVQMWRHSSDLKDRLDKGAMSAFKAGFKEIPFTRNTRLGAFMRLNNVRRPTIGGIFKRKRKIKRHGLKFSVQKRRKYQKGEDPDDFDVTSLHSTSSGQRKSTLGRSLKRVGTRVFKTRDQSVSMINRAPNRAPGNLNRSRTMLPVLGGHSEHEH